MSQIVKIEGKAQIQWQAKTGPSGRWIGVCDPMHLATEADSLDELYSVINETMQLMLFDLLADNELEQFLKEHGWTAMQIPRNVKSPSDIEFNVPWALVAEGQGRNRGPERRSH